MWVVTIQQVLEWQKNPVPASQYQVACDADASLLGDLPGAKLCVMPAAGCVYVSSGEHCPPLGLGGREGLGMYIRLEA